MFHVKHFITFFGGVLFSTPHKYTAFLAEEKSPMETNVSNYTHLISREILPLNRFYAFNFYEIMLHHFQESSFSCTDSVSLGEEVSPSVELSSPLSEFSSTVRLSYAESISFTVILLTKNTFSPVFAA